MKDTPQNQYFPANAERMDVHCLESGCIGPSRLPSGFALGQSLWPRGNVFPNTSLLSAVYGYNILIILGKLCTRTLFSIQIHKYHKTIQMLTKMTPTDILIFEVLNGRDRIEGSQNLGPGPKVQDQFPKFGTGSQNLPNNSWWLPNINIAPPPQDLPAYIRYWYFLD